MISASVRNLRRYNYRTLYWLQLRGIRKKFTEPYIRHLYPHYLETSTEPYVTCLCAKHVKKFTYNYICIYNPSS